MTLRSSPAIQGPAREFFGPFSEHLRALVAEFPLDQFEAFLQRLRTTMDGMLTERD